MDISNFMPLLSQLGGSGEQNNLLFQLLPMLMGGNSAANENGKKTVSSKNENNKEVILHQNNNDKPQKACRYFDPIINFAPIEAIYYMMLII